MRDHPVAGSAAGLVAVRKVRIPWYIAAGVAVLSHVGFVVSILVGVALAARSVARHAGRWPLSALRSDSRRDVEVRNMPGRAKVIVGAVIGLALGAGLGQLAGWLVRSDNVPFFVALGALVGVCVGLVVALTLSKTAIP